MNRLAVLLAILSTGAACSTEEPIAAEKPAALSPPRVGPRKLDVLFVVDDSGSMAEEQVFLADTFDRFMAGLGTLPEGLPDLHLGVVSTSIGLGAPDDIAGCAGRDPGGVLQNQPRVEGCTPPTGRYIADEILPDGTRQRNYTASLAETFGCIAQLGKEGCGFEQPLEAMQLALDGSNPENAGFLRQDAGLALVFLTDEDDCSADPSFFVAQDSDPQYGFLGFRCAGYGWTCDGENLTGDPATYSSCEPRVDSPLHDPAGYVSFVDELKPGRHVVVAALASDTPGASVGQKEDGSPTVQSSCTSSHGSAFPAIRLLSFVEAWPHVIESICAESFEQPSFRIGQSIAAALLNAPVPPVERLPVDFHREPVGCRVAAPGAPGPGFTASLAAGLILGLGLLAARRRNRAP